MDMKICKECKTEEPFSFPDPPLAGAPEPEIDSECEKCGSENTFIISGQAFTELKTIYKHDNELKNGYADFDKFIAEKVNPLLKQEGRNYTIFKANQSKDIPIYIIE